MRRILTVVAATLVFASCGGDDDGGGDAADDDALSTAPATVATTTAEPTTTLGPPPVTVGDTATTAAPGTDPAYVDRDLQGDASTGTADGGGSGESDFCAANEEFTTLLSEFFSAADPEAAWQDVRAQLDVVLEALPAEISGPEADAGRAYYDQLEEHFEEHAWDLAAALEAPPEVPPAVLLYENDVSEYTRANCS